MADQGAILRMGRLNRLRKSILYTTITTVSPEVAAAIAIKTQIPTIVAMMCDPALHIDDYGSAVCRAAAGTALKDRSLKTWQNYVSAARAVNHRAMVHHQERLLSMMALTEWLTSQLTAGGFVTSPDDVANWALGRDSIRFRNAEKAQREAAEAAEGAKVRLLRNPDLRNQRFSKQAEQTPKKESAVRPRAVAECYEAAKADAKLYLREQYTNSNGVMTCQVCKAELPFKLPNGAYYFEAVEITDTLGKRFRETYLALCPNHAAMFKYANKQKTAMVELVAMASGLEIDVVLAGKATTLQFTEMHLADMKACLEAEDVD